MLSMGQAAFFNGYTYHVKPPILDVQITMFGCFTRQTLRIFPLKSLLKLTEGHEPRLGSRIPWIRTVEMEPISINIYLYYIYVIYIYML